MITVFFLLQKLRLPRKNVLEYATIQFSSVSLTLIEVLQRSRDSIFSPFLLRENPQKRDVDAKSERVADFAEARPFFHSDFQLRA